MARPLLSLTSPMHNLLFFSSMPTTLLFAILSVLCVFSVITFLCGSEKLKKFHIEAKKAATTRGSNSKEQKLISKLNSNISNRALSMVKMLSWRKVQEGEVEGEHSDQDEEALWRKNILMGEKCRPLSFSGKIENDSEGKN